jgi:hypothetical protein
MSIFCTLFALRHFNSSSNVTKKIKMPCSADEFVDLCNKNFKNEYLKDGYANFCKHLFIPNELGVINNIVEITNEILPFIRSGYIRRTPKELPVLCRWLPQEFAVKLNILHPAFVFIIFFLHVFEENILMSFFIQENNVSLKEKMY